MLISFSPIIKMITEGKDVSPLKIRQHSMHPSWRLLVLHSAGNLIFGDASPSMQTNGIWNTGLYAQNHRVQAVENPPGEKLAAHWNNCTFVIFNGFHHRCCCQSLLSIKLHKIQTLGNKHRRLSAYVKSQFFFLYSNFTWKLLVVRRALRLSPPPEGWETRSGLRVPRPTRCPIPKANKRQ